MYTRPFQHGLRIGLGQVRKFPYTEDDAPGPVSVYGASKLAGEHLVRSICPKYFLIRTCGLYGLWGSGGKGGNFVETMLAWPAKANLCIVVGDQVCTPSYTKDIAVAVAALCTTQPLRDLPRHQCGLLHLV